MSAAISNQIEQSTPSAQAARDTDDGLGDLLPMLALGAGMYFGLPAIGEALGWTGMSTADALAATGLDLGTAGSGAAAGVGAGAGGGFVDALGGMTDASGTALPGWGAAAGDAGTLSSLIDSGSSLGSGVSATGGTTGISGTATGTLSGSAGALGSTSGAAGMVGTIPGIGTLTAEGMLIPAAGGAAVSLSSLSPSSLSSVLDWAKSFTTSPSGSSSPDWLRTLGSLASAGLGAYASSQQTDALDEMARRYEGYGAPYRQKLSDLYANPDSFLNSNEVRKPVQMGTDMLMRSLSTQGNPFGSGNALQQGQSYASDQLFGKIGQEKDRLAGFGGLSAYSAAAPTAATNAIQSSGNIYNAIGSGIGNIFNPPKTGAQTIAELMRSLGGNNG
jgi:hypothetical protein